MASISEKLRAVVMSGVITATSFAGTSAMAADNPQQTANAAPAATQTAQRVLHQWRPGTFEDLFLNYNVEKQLSEGFWDNSKAFAGVVKQNAAKGNFWNMPVREGVPPIAQFMPGYEQISTEMSSRGALNIRQFADYVNFVNLNGDPRLTAAGKSNPLYARVIIGVVTPRDLSGVDPNGLAKTAVAVKDRLIDGKEIKSEDNFWRARMAAAKREAVAIEKKYGASHGASVYEIVRVVADDNETIIRELGSNKGKPMPLKDALIVTVPGRATSTISYNMYDLETVLEQVFVKNNHIMSNREYYCEPGSHWAKTDVCAPAADVQKGLAGTAGKGKSGSGGGKGTVGSGKVASEGPAL